MCQRSDIRFFTVFTNAHSEDLCKHTPNISVHKPRIGDKQVDFETQKAAGLKDAGQRKTSIKEGNKRAVRAASLKILEITQKTEIRLDRDRTV